jgi:thioredoxin 1
MSVFKNERKSQMAGMNEFTDGNFQEEVIASSIPVVVDFTAPWCGPCKMLGPILEELVPVFEGKAKIGKVNVDNSPQTASKYGIISIPTILFVKNGVVVDQHVGLLGKESLKKKIEQFVS